MPVSSSVNAIPAIEVTLSIATPVAALHSETTALTALHVACSPALIDREAQVAIVRRLLDAGADARATLPGRIETGPIQGVGGETPLHFAVWSTQNALLVPLLVGAGADVEARSDEGSRRRSRLL